MTVRPLLLQNTHSRNGAMPDQNAATPGSSAAVSRLPDVRVAIADLPNFLSEWIDDGEWRGHTLPTRALHHQIARNLLWFLAHAGMTSCGHAELRRFFLYLQNAHAEPGGLWHGDKEKGLAVTGRWGDPRQTKKVKSGTVVTYHRRIKTFFAWMVTQGYLPSSPADRLAPPLHRADQLQPLSGEQMLRLAEIARTRLKTTGRRDETVLWLLYDTGIRAAELCSLTYGDLDMQEKRITFCGKGGKRRSVYFGRWAAKALWSYLREQPAEDGGALAPLRPLFPAESGKYRGQHLNPGSLNHILHRINAVAGVTGVRVSPHTLRHSFAVNYLRAGGSMQALKEILGHTTLQMTMKYVSLAEADLAGQASFSPADRLNGSSKSIKRKL